MEEKLNKINYNSKGITIIALIVTIVILLILASITIATLTRRQWCYNKCFTC